MNAFTLRRLSGMAAVAAGPLCLIGGLTHPIEDGHAHSPEALAQPHTLGSAALLTGTVLLLLGLPGVYGWIGPRAGRLGLVGYLLYFLGNLLSAVPHLVLMTFASSDLAHHHPGMVSTKDAVIAAPAFEAEQLVSGIGLVAGLLVFAIALVRTAGLPRWVGWTGIAGAVVALAPLPVLPVVTGLQFELLRGAMLVGLGVLAIRSTRVAVAAMPSPALVA
ncbi:hypothetical protein [Virgisporangium aurantiacum]|uniref:Uncharacterized protein n=1 Tax=Virgisporangium aurantiacum TaxID=175570 RepID=A0A8J3Z5E6_9ACTN|nr:hypothetical protein [Virgisporangium aurantiacum]GIJ57751.1 hypothetical protein Vau01_052670 [Virgisporangium aurantiacum]